EGEVIEAADEGELGNLRRGAVAADPVEEILVVQRPKPPLVRPDPAREPAARHGREDGKQVPRAPQVRVLLYELAQSVVCRRERTVERLDRVRDAGPVERVAKLRGSLEDRREHAHAQTRHYRAWAPRRVCGATQR